MSWCCFNVWWNGREETALHGDFDGFPRRSNIKLFTYRELISATSNFHPSNKIGQGGFGAVYKGILKNGTKIAIKVLSARSKQGWKEFLTEIDTIANVKHPNLVELVGFCIEGTNRILVYDYAENSSLDRALLSSLRETVLDWNRRSAICVGTAAGLKFLHEEVIPNIVHRDIKASNVLLDGNFVPKIGDFGLAKLFPDDITHISTRVAGTTGYLAPEYAIGGKLTKKADIYSFGVLILEIVSGRRSLNATFPGVDMILLEQAWRFYEEGRLVELVDPKLTEYPEEEVLKYIKIALFCTQGVANRRPSMVDVLEMLTNKKIKLKENELTPPGLVGNVWETSATSKYTHSLLKHRNSSPRCTSAILPDSTSEMSPR